MYQIFSLLIFFCLVSPSQNSWAESQDSQAHKEMRYVMGTLLEITLYSKDAAKAKDSLQQSFAIAEHLDQVLSNYKTTSEISKLNSAPLLQPQQISSDFYEFLLLAKRLSHQTQGFFDITVGPYLDIWHGAKEENHIPSSLALSRLHESVGFKHIDLLENNLVVLTRPGMRLDSGGLGKGFAVDKIAHLLRSLNIESALINFGRSSVYAISAPPTSERGWRLAVQFPNDNNKQGDIWLKDQAFSGSDSHGSPIKIQGHDYGHIVNPHDGMLVDKRVKALVVAKSATVAEAVSKYVVLHGIPDTAQSAELGIEWSKRLMQ